MGLSLKSVVKGVTGGFSSVLGGALKSAGFFTGGTSGMALASGNTPTSKNVLVDAAGLGAGAVIATSGLVAGTAASAAGGTAAASTLMPAAVAETTTAGSVAGAGAAATASTAAAAAGKALLDTAQRKLSDAVSSRATPNNLQQRADNSPVQAAQPVQASIPLILGVVLLLVFIPFLLRRG